MASSSPPWGIFATIPRVCAADADLPPGADLSLALAAPPGISFLTVPPRVSPDHLTSRNFPSVLAADPSGLFLLHATQGAGDRTGGPIVYGYGDGPAASTAKLATCRREFVHGYFLCDARSATASRLPDPDGNRILDAGNLGLLTRDGGRTFLLAELQPIVGSDVAVLLRYSSQTRRWVSKAVDYPLAAVRPWASHGVLSLGERLFWFDVSWGLLTCLPFEEDPVLEFVPLPVGNRLPFQCTSKDLQRFACFAVSDGAVRFVSIGVPSRPTVIVERVKKLVRRHGQRRDPWITSYTLCRSDGCWSWRIDHELPFQDIWSHESYQSSGLTKKCPKLACIDPYNPHSVYFFLDNFIFNLDLTSASLQKCARFHVNKPTRKHMCSRFVIACQTPPASPSSPSAA